MNVARSWRNDGRYRRPSQPGYSMKSTCVCEVFGIPFLSRPRRHKDANRCCSRECGFELQRRERAAARFKRHGVDGEYSPIWFRLCRGCGKPFGARRKNRLQCSEECDREYARRNSVEWSRSKSSRDGKAAVCKECRKPYVIQYGLKLRDYCSHQCQTTRLHRINRALSKAIRRGCTATERVDPRDVFERDAYCCWICGGETSGRVPDANAPTLDHVHPISEGGSHTMNNLRCAHFRCNWERWYKDWPGVAIGMGHRAA